jgi:AcrR family transcriptional regulator
MKSSKTKDISSIGAVRKLKRGPGRPSTTEPSGEELRELIIAAASQDYAEHGYHGSSVAHILAIAGISRPTFYRYFKNRREVVTIVIGRLNDLLREIIADLSVGENTLHDFINASIDAYFAWGRQIGLLVGPIYREINDPESPASEHRLRIIAELTELFQTVLVSMGRPRLDPLLYEGLLHVIEHIGHTAFWPEEKSETEIVHRRLIISRILIASLALPDDYDHLPPLGQLEQD